MSLHFVCCVIIFPVLLVSAFDTVAMAEGLSWSLRKSPHVEDVIHSSDRNELHVVVTAQKTQISSSSTVLFIDYKDMALYRFERLSERCLVFDLERTEPTEVSKKTVSRLAEFSVKESDEKRDIEGLHCVKKTVLAGAGMFRYKTFVSKVLVRYGQPFSEAVAEYFVSQELEHWQMLLEFVTHRQVAFNTRPLLKRIDPLGLIEAVSGFPVQGWQKSRGVKLDFLLISGPERTALTLRPPQGCESVSRQSNNVK